MEVSAAVVQLLAASRAFTKAYAEWQDAGGPDEDPRSAALREAAGRLDDARRRVVDAQGPKGGR